MFCAQLNCQFLVNFFFCLTMLSIGFKLNCVDEPTSFELVKVYSFVSGGKSMIQCLKSIITQEQLQYIWLIGFIYIPSTVCVSECIDQKTQSVHLLILSLGWPEGSAYFCVPFSDIFKSVYLACRCWGNFLPQLHPLFRGQNGIVFFFRSVGQSSLFHNILFQKPFGACKEKY